ncbi:MAG: 2-oxoglutarate dehydrogenase E1 component [Rhodospirillales bacterium]|nr:2-oxoglutarate dehydrogenase E1 component [Rhodospirillales bacterium]
MSDGLDGASSFLGGADPAVIEQLHAQYLRDPASVDPSWRRIFEGEVAGTINRLAEKQTENDSALGLPEPRPPAAPPAESGDTDGPVQAETIDSIRALMMIRAYRVRGHLIASLDPLGLEGERHHPELDPKSYGFSETDYDRPIYVDGVLGLKHATLREVLAILRQTYCARIGVEFMHIQYPDRKAWVQRMMEGERNRQSLSRGEKTEILRHLHEAEGFERFLDVKYAGAKRFSLEGSESVIPALEAVIAQAARQGVDEIVIGMAHRGRLNVLTSIMGKSYAAVFSEFQGGVTAAGDVQGSGDVKYHLGASADRVLEDGHTLHISLTPNPSHLEAVNPVVLGKVRAKQAMRRDRTRERVMGLLIHGDAALAGQGTCSEVFELSELRGYRTGGTVHIVINNQIGFTTSPAQARTSPYPTEVAKIIQAPVFHVNGDDPEAVVRVCQIAADYRQHFKADVVVDIFCYRRHGHNEGDEPAFTQPAMYRAIGERSTTRQIYTERLVAEGVLTVDGAEAMMETFRAKLETELEASKSYRPNKADWLEGDWADIEAAPRDERPGDTAAAPEVLAEVGRAITRVPADFAAHPRIRRQLEQKRQALDAGGPIDWATAEALAFGSLLLEGKPIRLSGQDCSRGTFSQRHAGLIDQENESRYVPLNNIRPDQARMKLADSLLSEAGVLGFEYGHSIADPNALAIWEAQFGDFANGAQVIIDQFVAAGEAKWLRMSGLVMLLPHGFEGQGPEHSSARLERYLQLYADGNIQVVNCSTPASYFHVLRRQLRRSFRKPLIVMSPKSLLRHKRCVSPLEEMSGGARFHRVIGEADPAITPERARRVVFCSGKVYYDLLAAREERGIDDVALLRLEQIAPFPSRSLMVEFAKYGEAEVVWCQEEPENMGAWTFVAPRIEQVLTELDGATRRPRYVGRAAAASPATGFLVLHQREQRALIEDALGAEAGS